MRLLRVNVCPLLAAGGKRYVPPFDPPPPIDVELIGWVLVFEVEIEGEIFALLDVSLASSIS
jgi:hypothetical protein